MKKKQLEHQILGMKNVHSCRNCGHLTLENDLSVINVKRDGTKICW
ncbi:MAG: hypothetical protein ACLFMM_06910 [Methanohalobium sp.]